MAFDAKVAMRALTRTDPVLGRAIRGHGAFALKPRRDRTPFALLTRAVINQQLSNKAAATIEARLIAALGDGLTPESVLAAGPERLRAVGLSRAKSSALLDLAAKTLDGTIPSFRALSRMSDDTIIEHLTQVRGIGLWSAQMFLIFSLARPDVMPAQDLGVRKGFQLLYGGRELPSPQAVLSHAEIWRPWRSVAAWYLWRVTDGSGKPVG